MRYCTVRMVDQKLTGSGVPVEDTFIVLQVVP